MKKISLILAVVLCMTAAVCRADSANGYIVKLKDSNQVALFAATSDSIANDTITPVAENFRLYAVQTKQLCDELIATGTAEYAEPNQTVTLCGDLGMPDDPDYPASQVNIFKIKAISAWNLGIYGNDVKIGYVDSGIYPHSELKAAIAGGHNYITTDGDDSSAKTDEGTDGDKTDDYGDTYGHGTFGAGIIAAEANSFGGIGVAPRAKLYSLKCFTGRTGKLVDIISAVNGAVNTFGCKVINMSFGFESSSPSLAAIINDACSKGVIFVAAAGNDNKNSSSYPGAYSNVISVASFNLDEKKDSFSNYGTGVNLAAQGSKLKGCDITGEKAFRWDLEGTSFAAPCVSAAAALCLNINPNMTQSEFMTILNSTCTPLEDNSYYLGAGMLNIENIMNYMMNGKTVYYSPVSVYNGKAFQVITNFGEEPLSFADIWGADGGYGLKNVTVDPNTSYKSSFAVSSADSKIKRFLWKSIESLVPIYKYSNQ